LLQVALFDVILDGLFPHVDLAPRFLFGCHVFLLEGFVGPPVFALAIACNSLGKERVADLDKFGDVDLGGDERPITAAAGWIFEISLIVGGAGEDVLPLR